MTYLALQQVVCRFLAFPFGRSAPESSESRIPPALKKRARNWKVARAPALQDLRQSRDSRYGAFALSIPDSSKSPFKPKPALSPRWTP
jgi:hypothetical protein